MPGRPRRRRGGRRPRAHDRPRARRGGWRRRTGGRGTARGGGPEAGRDVRDGDGEHQGTGEGVHVEEVRPAAGAGQRQREVHEGELQTRNTQQGQPIFYLRLGQPISAVLE